MRPQKNCYVSWKRALDVVFALALIPALSPIFAAAVTALLIFEGRPILFVQTRIGRGQAPFGVLKLRTMETCNPGVRGPVAEQAVTRVGGFLRRWSIDELPQLLNILRGEMSFVGPRPLLPEYLPLYSPRQATRHLVQPGLTGLAQVSGRNLLPWESKLEMDALYVERLSFRLDFLIIAKSLWVAARGVGAGHSSDSLQKPLKISSEITND